MGRPKRARPARHLQLTLDETDHELLAAYALQAGKHIATVGAHVLVQALRASVDADGTFDMARIEAHLRDLRGELPRPASLPRWEWPVEVILSDQAWLDQWLPRLNELLGRNLTPSRSGAYGDRPGPVLDRRGYSNLMEFLFPTVVIGRNATSWRSLDYPTVSAKEESDEAQQSLRNIWEAVIRHTVTALCSLEDTAQPDTPASGRILIEEQIAGPWLRTLGALTGERAPDALPSKRLS